MELLEIERRTTEQGCFDRSENQRIYAKFFATVPRSFLKVVSERGLDRRKVLDVGCGYGHYLVHFGPGSMGLDANETSERFARSIGLEVLQCNVEETIPLPRESFEAVWCANLIEHMVAPHLLLSRLHRVLVPDGLLIAKVPVIPPALVRTVVRLIGKPLGYEAGEHVNAFTPATFAFTLERAGFKPIEAISIVLPSPAIQAVTAPLTRRLGASITVVAEKDPSFTYADKRLQAFDPRWTETGYRVDRASTDNPVKEQ